jgi:hypothetical protein
MACIVTTQNLVLVVAIKPVRSAYQPPASSIFLSEQINHQPAVFFSQNKSATSNQPAVLFSQNKPAPTISHQPNEQAVYTSSNWTYIQIKAT